MQLNQVQNDEQNIFNQQNFYNQERNYSKEDYVDSEDGEAEGEEDEEQSEDQEQEEIQEQQEESDNEENMGVGGMQSKFAGMQMENARMFDEDISQDKNSILPSLQNPQMEPIEEGYSSDESFGTKQKYRNMQENLEILKQEQLKEAAEAQKRTLSNPKKKRNHINLKTSQTDNKENINNRNKDAEHRATMPNSVQNNRGSLKRPGTAKMKTTNGFRNTYSRPQTAKMPKGKKRPATALNSNSVFASNKKNLKTKMKKKSDPVSRYQQMQNSWSKNKFLSQHKGTKQGRKLDLAGFNQWARMVQSLNQKPVVKQVHRYINPNMPLASNKRDDLRFHLRAKMSQEDYVDKDMKHFHYQKSAKLE